MTSCKQKTTELSKLGMKGFLRLSRSVIDTVLARVISSKSSRSCNRRGPMASLANRTPCHRTKRWMNACPIVLIRTAGSNSDLGGLTSEGCLFGCGLQNPMNAAESNTLLNTTCTSDGLDPCSVSAAKHHKPKIVCNTVCCVCITMPAQVSCPRRSSSTMVRSEEPTNGAAAQATVPIPSFSASRAFVASRALCRAALKSDHTSPIVGDFLVFSCSCSQADSSCCNLTASSCACCLRWTSAACHCF
mmetsp:Transcript_53720/g.120677  ORF Transcript_53720/g.120677 Transcript_53720/m.120677 type:complete len:246 (+) Transcript_53720:492-1229(+)